jgi:hypothetical protein
MDEETVSLLANTLYQDQLVTDLMAGDPTMTREQAREFVRNNMMRYRKNDIEMNQIADVTVPVVMNQMRNINRRKGR